MQRMGHQFLSFLSGHGGHLLRRLDIGQNRWTARLFKKQLPMGDYAGATEQSQRQCMDRHAQRTHDGKPSGQGFWASGADNSCKDEEARANCRRGSNETAKEREEAVFDLVNCGPNSRFAVVDKNGELMLVHNCGFVYYSDEFEDPDFRLCQELHTAKVDAVESILEETNEPLVVVYYHKASLEQLKKKFKNRLVELDKDGRAQDAWNAGKIELLAFQYKRGAMGLSLQHGGRNICLFAPTFVADDYAQVLERLGPLRQMQSGYNRVVNVFRIHAANTEDSRVYGVAEKKITAEQALIEMMNT